MLDSLTDWIVFIAVVLILFGGANKIPELARGLGRAVGEFRKAQIEMEKEINGMASSGVNKPNPNAPPQTVQQNQRPEEGDANRAAVEKRIAELEAEINKLKRLVEN